MQFKGKTVLVTAGPTHEPIDPVRYISNHSSGKMGFSIAEVLASKGAIVKLITGPVSLNTKNPSIQIQNITTAEEMYNAVLQVFPSCDITIMAAAVADFTPENPSDIKIKKKNLGNEMVIRMKPTKDILHQLGLVKKQEQVLIGFSLETNNEIANAMEKLRNKNLDFIVLNSLKDVGAGFAHDTNKITILAATGDEVSFTLRPKSEVAKDIVAYLEKTLKNRQNGY